MLTLLLPFGLAQYAMLPKLRVRRVTDADSGIMSIAPEEGPKGLATRAGTLPDGAQRANPGTRRFMANHV